MSGRKFKIGQLVTHHSRERAPGAYHITQLLPPEGDVRLANVIDAILECGRVAKESELRRA
jgi:hypothetical protein